MRIIGAGLPRTATLTQKIALETLGVGPCYHMVTVLSDLDQVGCWHRALGGDVVWDDVFAGYGASVDWPGAFFYRQLMDAYPDAKVLLSVRDPRRWAASMRTTILGVYRGDSLMTHLSRARAVVDPAWRSYNEMTHAMLFGPCGLLVDVADDDDSLAARFVRHVEEVKATVAPGRLLVWEASDGWEPLCDFVGAPVPSHPVPHVNDSVMFEERVVDAALAVLNQDRQGHPPATSTTTAAKVGGRRP